MPTHMLAQNRFIAMISLSRIRFSGKNYKEMQDFQTDLVHVPRTIRHDAELYAEIASIDILFTPKVL